MKKFVTALLIFTMATGSAQAQFFKLGPRIIGGSVSRLRVNLAKDSTAYQSLKLRDDLGYHVGVFARFSLASIYVQPELLVSGYGARFSKEGKENKLRFTQLEVPTMVGFSFLGIGRVQLGPTFSLLFKASSGKEQVKKHYCRMTVGWQGGLGVDIWKLVVDLKYGGSLSRFGDKIGNVDTKHGYGLWMLSIGFNLL